MNHLDQIADGAVRLNGVSQVFTRINLVMVLTPLAMLNQIAIFFEICDNSLNGAFGNANLMGHFS